MTTDGTLLRLLLADDIDGVRAALTASEEDATAPTSPLRHLVAALMADDPRPHLGAASRLARATRDRQLVALCSAHLAGQHDRVQVLVRDHLVDHPDSLLAAWVASRGPAVPHAHRPTHHQE